MKKIKLFLLTLIVSILSICCFINAGFVGDYTDVLEIPYNGRVSLPKTNSGYVIIDSNCSRLNIFSPQATSYSNGNFFNCTSFPCVISSNTLSNYQDIQVGYKLSYCNFGGVNFKVSYVGSSSKMPVSALTPAINGLHDTVLEIIPYVVYIGIGVLLMIIGFYAIRWLVNWMGGKINSIFKSKRF